MSPLDPLDDEKRDVKRENGIRLRLRKKFSVEGDEDEEEEEPPELELDSDRLESPPLELPAERSESRGSEKESEARRGNLLLLFKKFSIKVLSKEGEGSRIGKLSIVISEERLLDFDRDEDEEELEDA